MDAGLALDSSNLDSAVQATLMESINDSLRDVENKAYDVSKDANQNLQSLEQIRQNVDDEITDSQKAKKKLDQTKKLLDTLGVGKSLEKGVNKLDDHLQEATGLKGESHFSYAGFGKSLPSVRSNLKWEELFMGLLGSLFSAAADIAKETITETMNQNETEKFIKIMIERDAQNAEANEKLYQDWLTHERSNYFAAKKNTIIHDAFDVLMDSFEDTGKFDFSAVDSLSDELKSSDSYKQEAADVVNLCCEALVKLHQKCLYFHSICYADNSQFTALRRYCP